MADITALENRIRSLIKTNGNQEITGAVAQQVLLDIADSLNTYLEAEATARQTGDSTLSGGINTERQARIDADNTLGGRITNEIRQEAQRAEAAFDNLDLIDAAGSALQPTQITLTLLKNDGSEEDPNWRTLAELVLPSATEQRAGLMSAKDKQNLSSIIGDIYTNKNKGLTKAGGALYNAEGYNTSDFIPTDGITILYINGYIGSTPTILAYYNSDKQFISAPLPAGGGPFVVPKSDFPTGTKYIRVSDGGSSNAYAFGAITVTSLNIANGVLSQRITDELRQEAQRAEAAFDNLDLIDAAGSALQPTQITLTLLKNDGSEEDPNWRTLAELVLPSATEQRAGLMSAEDKQNLSKTIGYLNSTIGDVYANKNKGLKKAGGALYNAEGYNTSDLIPIDGIIKLYIKGYIGSTPTILAYYNSDKQFIGVPDWPNGRNEREVVPSDFPAGTKYIRVSDGGDSPNAYAIGVITLGGLEKRISLLEQADDVPTKNSTKLVKSGGTYAQIQKAISFLKSTIGDIYTNKNKGLTKAGGALYNAEGYNTSDLIPIDGITTLYINGYVGSTPTILAYYNSDKQFIGVPDWPNGRNEREVVPSDFPAGTKYIRVSDGGDSSNAYAIGVPTLLGLPSSILKSLDFYKAAYGDSSVLYYRNVRIVQNGAESQYDGYYATDFISIEGVKSIFFKGSNGSSVIGLAFYDSNKNYLGYYGTPSTSYEKEIPVTEFPSGTVYIKATNSGNNLSNCYIYVPNINNLAVYISKLLNKFPDNSGVIVTNITKFFSVSPETGYGRRYSIKLYLEGFLRNRYSLVFDNYLREKIIADETTQPSSGNYITRTIPISIKEIAGNSLVEKSVSLIKSSIQRGVNKDMRLLCIGDSTLDMNLSDEFGRYIGGWNYASIVKQFIEMDNADIGNISATLIGTRNYQSGRTVEYNNTTIPIRSFSEGRAGWTCYGYLNFPCPVKMGVAYEANARLNSTAAWYALGLATRTPFDSSIAGQNWESFENTDEQKMLIATTPFGRYKSDVGNNSAQYEELQDLWIKVNNMSGVWSPGIYTGSTSQKTTIREFFDNKIENPDNPFYDKNTAQAYTGSYNWTNDYAFSLDKYLERYRTMDDVGVRLSGSAGESVTGSDGLTYTIGTKVSNVSDYDVCRPNFVFVGTGINDVDAGLTVAEQTINNLINRISSEVRVAWGIPRSPGVFYNCYKDLNAYVFSSGGGRFDINEIMFATLNDSTPTSQKMFLPIYNTMSVKGGNGCKGSYNLDDDATILSEGGDRVHPSLYQSRTIAYQIYAWLYYAE